MIAPELDFSYGIITGAKYPTVSRTYICRWDYCSPNFIWELVIMSHIYIGYELKCHTTSFSSRAQYHTIRSRKHLHHRTITNENSRKKYPKFSKKKIFLNLILFRNILQFLLEAGHSYWWSLRCRARRRDERIVPHCQLQLTTPPCPMLSPTPMPSCCPTPNPTALSSLFTLPSTVARFLRQPDCPPDDRGSLNRLCCLPWRFR